MFNVLSLSSKELVPFLNGPNSTDEELARPTVKKVADFVVRDTSSSKRKIALLAMQTIFFPWGLYEAAKYSLQRLIMIPLYPAQSQFVQNKKKYLNPTTLNEIRPKLAPIAKELNFFLKEVTLERNGISYDGLLLGKKETIQNGKWVLQSTGNRQPVEYALDSADFYARAGFNTLLVNGPSVGRSQGHAVPQSMGEVQETALQFLESALKAKQIAIAGYSLGGAMIGQAILQHKFRKDVNYLVIRQMTFDRTSNIAKKILPVFKTIAKHLVLWTGLEMDSVAASKKLQGLGIREVIIQTSKKGLDRESAPSQEDFETDGVIPARGGLGYRLIKEGVTHNKVFRRMEGIDHNDQAAVFEATLDELKKHFKN